MAIRWFNAKRTARDTWAGNYAVIDVFLAGLTVLLEMIALFLLAIIGKYWCRSVNH